MRALGLLMVIAAVGLGSCYYVDPTTRTCLDGYPKQGGQHLSDHYESWLVCFPDAGNIRCENYDAFPLPVDEGASIRGRNLCELDGGNPCAGGPDPAPRDLPPCAR